MDVFFGPNSTLNQRTTTAMVGKVENKDTRWVKTSWEDTGRPRGAQNTKEKVPPGAHSHHLYGGLIGPHGWQEWEPKRCLKWQGKDAFVCPLPPPAGALIGPHGWGELAPKRCQKQHGKGTPWAPIPISRGCLDRPPYLAGMGAQNEPKTIRVRHPPGAHSRHPHGALIGLHSW